MMPSDYLETKLPLKNEEYLVLSNMSKGEIF